MRRSGSVTVFLALSLLCVFSVFFALLETARVSAVKANVQMSTAQAGDGLLASYNRDLWENYRVLFWEGEQSDFPSLSQAGILQEEIVQGNTDHVISLSSNFYLLSVQLTDVDVTGYRLATDDGGLPFCRQAAETMKKQAGEKVVNALFNLVRNSDSSEEGSSAETSAMQQEQDAMDVLEDLKNHAASAPEETSEQTDSAEKLPEKISAGSSTGNSSGETDGKTDSSEVTVKENPIQWMADVKKNGIYSLVMPENQMSAKEVDLSDSLENRSLLRGSMASESSLSVTEKAWFRVYLGSYFQNEGNASGEGTLDYEMEYLIGGKKSDKQNMKIVINRLLLAREAANMLYLETDAQKQQEAAGVAATLSTAFGLPELEPVVEQGILAAWAFAESISDVRILLDGGKVSLVKTSEQWHTDLANLAGTVGATSGNSQKKGLTYSEYLQTLMWTMKDQTLAYRAMDLIEWKTDTRMDQMVCSMDCTYTYQAPKVFWNFVTLANQSFSSYQFQDTGSWSYEKQ